MELHYLIGDATEPIVKPAIISHVCNDCVPGAWGAGFVMALSKKNKDPEKAYRKWSLEGPEGGYELGAIQLVPFAEDVMVANMIAQHEIRWRGKIPPIRYDAVEKCLTNVYKHALEHGWTVAMPRIGCVLAGGDWLTIENIIKKVMTVDTYVYTIPSQKDRWPTKYENDTADTSKVDISSDLGDVVIPPDIDSTADTTIVDTSDLGSFFN
jgi:O-acetyl-ADP-ribose deacetylase (regulator of RNase III)